MTAPQEVAESLVDVEDQREHVGVGVGRRGDHGLRVMLFQRGDLLLADLGRLEIQRGGGLVHPAAVVLDDQSAAAGEHVDDLVDPARVLFP